jgi:hypothetical protein
MKAFKATIQTDENKSFYTNPYDYIQTNDTYFELQSQGLPAIPKIEKGLKDEEADELYRFLLADCLEKINRSSLRQLGMQWGTSEEFVSEWESFKSGLYKRVDDIILSEDTDYNQKVQSLIDCGLIATPIIERYLVNNTVDEVLSDKLIELINSYSLLKEDKEFLKVYMK